MQAYMCFSLTQAYISYAHYCRRPHLCVHIYIYDVHIISYSLSLSLLSTYFDLYFDLVLYLLRDQNLMDFHLFLISSNSNHPI